MAAQYELLSQLLKSGGRLDMGQELFYKFYQAFVLKDRWLQYIGGVGTTLLVTAIALAMGVLLGSVVALVRVAHDQQRPGRRNPVLGVLTPCQVYTAVDPAPHDGAAADHEHGHLQQQPQPYHGRRSRRWGINPALPSPRSSGAAWMAVDPARWMAGRSLGLNYITTMVVIIIPRPSWQSACSWATSSSCC